MLQKLYIIDIFIYYYYDIHFICFIKIFLLNNEQFKIIYRAIFIIL